MGASLLAKALMLVIMYDFILSLWLVCVCVCVWYLIVWLLYLGQQQIGMNLIRRLSVFGWLAIV